MSPEEFEVLTKVIRDPKEQVEFEVAIDPALLKKPLTVDELSGLIAIFYEKNKYMFDNPADIGFDKKALMLKFKGSESLANELMQKLGILGS